MFGIDGLRFFGVKEEASQDYTYIAYHLTADPEDFDLKRQKKMPICTIIVDANDYALYNEGLDSLPNPYKVKLLLNLYGLRSIIYNMYLHDEYYKFRDSFSNESKFPSTLIYISPEISIEEDHNVFVAAIPIDGMLAPVTKSRNYEIYNGKFIHCKPFKNTKSNPHPYSGIAYIYARLYSYIQVDQYKKQEDDSTIGEVHSIQYYPREVATYDKNEIRQLIGIHKDNGFLFEKPKRNLFHLSDVPAGVMEKDDTIRTMIKS